MANNCWITLKITMNPDRVRLNKKIGTDGIIRVYADDFRCPWPTSDTFPSFCVLSDAIVIVGTHFRKSNPRPKGSENMTQSTIDAIQALLRSDTTVTEEQAKGILRSCKQTTVRRHLINAREAMAILGVTRPTLRAYVNQGHLQQLNFSSRKVRFDADEVQRFANNGAQAWTGRTRNLFECYRTEKYKSSDFTHPSPPTFP